MSLWRHDEPRRRFDAVSWGRAIGLPPGARCLIRLSFDETMSEIDGPSPLAQALGRVPTGLYIVATREDDKPLGFVGSFVMQQAFEPPTVSVAIGRDREHLAAIRKSGRFAVSILDGASSSLMGAFFKKYEGDETPFDHLPHTNTPSGSPILTDALAWLDLEHAGEYDAGDHIVVFGTVTAGDTFRDGDPSTHLRKNGLEY